MRINPILLATSLALTGCDGCRELDPIDTDDIIEPDDTDRGDDTDPAPTADTSVDKPCPVPEVEPNNRIDAPNALPMERVGCGLFDTTVDADWWQFDLTEDSWLAVDVRAFALGSRADVSLTLSSTEAGVAAGISYWRDQPDVRVRFPSPPARYQAMIRQVVGDEAAPGEGEGYFYEVRASSTKAPIDATVTEAANESRATAQRLLAGPTGGVPVVLLGDVSGPTDQDWYEVVIPEGRHRLVVDVQAHELGSLGDFALELTPGAGPVVRSLTGQLGWERDPWLEYRSLSAETVHLRVLEEDASGGRPFWYALSITLEAE